MQGSQNIDAFYASEPIVQLPNTTCNKTGPSENNMSRESLTTGDGH